MTSPSGSGYVIENCQTLERYNVVFDTTSSLQLGSSFRTNYPNINVCYSIVSQLTDFEDWDLVNLPLIREYDDCEECLGDVLPFPVSYLVVGGGGGAGNDNGGGAGAGGYVYGNVLFDSFNTYTVVVGAGGISQRLNYEPPGTNGSDSKIIVNSQDFRVGIGGGGGGTNIQSGSTGGSGGGGGGFASTGFLPGTGSQPLSIWGGLGQFGGIGANKMPAGGGGASQAGQSATGRFGGLSGRGGSGSQWLDGLFYAGGGGAPGAITFAERYNNGLGGPGGGGMGTIHEYAPTNIAQYGEKNTGGGAGGSGFTNEYYSNGSRGGSGVVKLRYEGPEIKIRGGFVSKDGDDIYHTFINSTAMELSGSFTYPNGYVVKECTTGQVLNMAWDDTSSVQLDKTLLIDTRELEGCFTVSQSVQLGPEDWDYINIPFTSFDDCNTCITASYVYTASVGYNCLTNETASAWFDRGVNIQPGEVWSFSKTVNDIQCYTITDDFLLSNIAYEVGDQNGVFTFFNTGTSTTEGVDYPWTAPTQHPDCETCISQSVFATGSLMVNCNDENDTFTFYRGDRSLTPLTVGDAYKFNFDTTKCYFVSKSLYNFASQFDVVVPSFQYIEFDTCEDCLEEVDYVGFRMTGCDSGTTITVRFNNTGSLSTSSFYRIDEYIGDCDCFQITQTIIQKNFDFINPTTQSFNDCLTCRSNCLITASLFENCITETQQFYLLDNARPTVSSVGKIDDECWTFLGDQSTTVGNVLFDKDITNYYNTCLDCENNTPPTLWQVSASIGPETNFNINYVDQNNVSQSIFVPAQETIQMSSLFLITNNRPQITQVESDYVFIGPISPGSGSSFKINVNVGGGEGILGPFGLPFNGASLYGSNYDFTYRNADGDLITKTLLSGSNYQFCVTEVNEIGYKSLQDEQFIYNPFVLTKLDNGEDCPLLITASKLERCDNSQIDFYQIDSASFTIGKVLRDQNGICYTYLDDEIKNADDVVYSVKITQSFDTCNDCFATASFASVLENCNDSEIIRVQLKDSSSLSVNDVIFLQDSVCYTYLGLELTVTSSIDQFDLVYSDDFADCAECSASIQSPCPSYNLVGIGFFPTNSTRVDYTTCQGTPAFITGSILPTTLCSLTNPTTNGGFIYSLTPNNCY